MYLHATVTFRNQELQIRLDLEDDAAPKLPIFCLARKNLCDEFFAKVPPEHQRAVSGAINAALLQGPAAEGTRRMFVHQGWEWKTEYEYE